MSDPQNYRFEAAWPNPPEELCEAVVAFWLAESAMNEGVARERARQLLLVARSPDGNVAAVSTAYPMQIQQLGFECFFFRSFVGTAHRVNGLRPSGLIQQIVLRSYEHLNKRFRAGMDVAVRGLYFEVENSSVQRHRRQLVWSDLGANIVFIGQLANQRHARVWYFDAAQL